MAIIKCPECGKEISDKAAACPSCGCPIEETDKSKDTDSNQSGQGTEEQKNKETMVQPKEKKSPKKFIIACCVVVVIAIIGAAVYFITTADARNYKSAQQLFKEEKYKEALKKFTDLKPYEDSKDMAEKCEYELSVDGQFLHALSKGLTTRWDFISQESGLDEVKQLDKAIDQELDSIGDFYDKAFEDKDLGDAAISYIDVLKASKDSLQYYTIDFNKYALEWQSTYAKRTILLKQFVNDFGLSVPEKYQSELESIVKDAGAAQEQEKMQQDIDAMLGQFQLETTSDEWGITSYRLKMENTTDYTFDYFYVEINALDAEGNIIGSGNASQITNWAPGQKAEVEAWVDVEDISRIASTTYTPHYQSGNVYQ